MCTFHMAHAVWMTLHDSASTGSGGKLRKLLKKGGGKQHRAPRFSPVRQAVNKALIFAECEDQRFYTLYSKKRLIASQKQTGR